MTGLFVTNSDICWRRVWRNLRPGGWVEFQDFDFHLRSEDGTVKPDNKNVEMLELLHTACDKVGRPLSPGPLLEGWVRDTGFVNVDHLLMRIPLGTWPRDEQLVSYSSSTNLACFLSVHVTGRQPKFCAYDWLLNVGSLAGWLEPLSLLERNRSLHDPGIYGGNPRFQQRALYADTGME